MQLYGYGVDSVIVNRVLPEDEVPPNSFFEGYVESQRKYLEEIEQSFRPLPILQVPHLGEEVFGAERLGRIGDAMYSEREPTDVFYDEPTFTVQEDGDAYVLSLRLAFATEDNVDVRQLGDQLVVQVANQRSNVILPNFLNYYQMTSATLEKEWLRVRFRPDAESPSG